MLDDLREIENKLIEILSPAKGYFGRVHTWGQRPAKYEYIGYKLTKDFYLTLQKMSEEQHKNLKLIMTYFELHARPLKYLLDTNQKNEIDNFCSEIAWSHFMTVIMFGMLEVAVKKTNCAKLNNRGFLIKNKSIKCFLNVNLPKKVKKKITERYSVEKIFNYGKKIKNFPDVIDHLWCQIRSSFIHDAGIEARGLEWTTIEGSGTKDNPISLKQDVPMQDFLQMTWQAILNSYGYKGYLELPRHKRDK